MAAKVRLAELLGGLSMVADLGFGLPAGTAVRSCLVAAALGRRMDLGEADVRDCFYAALLCHVGCVAVAHEAAAAFGDDLALNRAVARTNLADPDDVTVTLLPELTTRDAARCGGESGGVRLVHGSEWGRRADVGVCEVARDTAGRLGLPGSTQQALYHLFEAWVGGWVPSGLRATTSPSARGSPGRRWMLRSSVSSEALMQQSPPFGRRAGVLLDPAVVATFREHAADLLAEAERGDPRDRLLEVEPEPVIERDDAQLTDIAAAFGDLADVKMPFLHGHARAVARLASGAARRLGLDDGEVRRVELAGFLHDVGRVGVSNAVWEKPASLNAIGVGAGAHALLLLRADPRRLAVIGTDLDPGRHAPRAPRRVRLPPGLRRCCSPARRTPHRRR